MELTGKAALVTGSRRIGAVVAQELARRGADVGLVYRSSHEEADEAAADIRALGRKAFVLQADLQEPDACAHVVDQGASSLGRLDILINMASRYHARPLDELTVADWDAQMAIDLRATWLCSRAAVPHMRRAGSGRIVNFSDWIARSGRPRYTGFLPYYVAKAGVVALTEALALELAPDQILVNAIAPGPVVPPDDMGDEEVAEVARVTPLGRWAGEHEIARAVVAVVESDFITGETIRVDGGRHLR